ncbi:extracellular solute-binding protein [Arachnia propionica]|uniref:Extracellular solute-binding protein n=1 Tax=Arachnia propionica TaxID=1750 RepID=A0A3P1TDH3_9ACTN|nr:extracellular solute-binding protein [Arachnia propionica]
MAVAPIRKGKRVKRVIKFGAVVAASALALSACGGGTPTRDGSGPASSAAMQDADPASLETTIKILAPSYSDSSKADWEKIIAEFNKTYPKVKVELQIEGWDDFSGKVQARIQAGDLPDILNDNAFAASAEEGLLYPMSEILTKETLDNIEPTLLANGQGTDGTQWAAPDIASARMLVYNTDLFAKAGIAEPPKTWAELEEASAKLTALGDGVKAYGLPLGSEEAQVESSLWLWGAGGSWVDGENLKADSPQAVEAFTQIKKMHSSGHTQDKLNSDRQEMTDLMGAGKLGMMVGHGQVVADSTAKGAKVALAPVPSKSGEAVATGVTDFIVAFDNKDEARKQATSAFLNLMYSDAVYEGWYKGTTLLPVTKSMIEKGKSEGDEYQQKFLEALSFVKFQPVSNPQWDALQGALQSSAYKIGEQDPEALLQEIQALVAASA